MKHFGNVGYVTNVYISRRRRVASSTFFAFVKFQHREKASKVIKVLHGKESKGFHLFVMEAKECRQQSKKLVNRISSCDQRSMARTNSFSFGDAKESIEPSHYRERLLKDEEYKEELRWLVQRDKVKVLGVR